MFSGYVHINLLVKYIHVFNFFQFDMNMNIQIFLKCIYHIALNTHFGGFLDMNMINNKLILLIISLSHYICGQPLDPTGMHLLRCIHGLKMTASHHVVQDAFVSIARNARIKRDARFHILREQTHFFHHLFFNLRVGELTLWF